MDEADLKPKSLDDSPPRSAQQENFIRTSCRHFSGLKSQLQIIESYIRLEHNSSVLVVAGEPGSGKSSLLAKSVSSLKTHLDFVSYRICYHFMDGAESNDLREMVLKFLAEVRLEDECKDLGSMCYKLHDYLTCNSSPKTVIFVDGMHQFTSENDVSIQAWLPNKLGRNIRVIVSVTIDTKEHELLIRERPFKLLTIPQLDLLTRKSLLKKLIRSGARTIPAEAVSELSLKPGASNPLWLTLAYRLVYELSGDDLLSKIASLPDTLIDIYEVCLSELESQRHGELMIAILSCLTISRSGLTKHELRHILKPESLKPPSPYVEKQDLEFSEKNQQCSQESTGTITESEWHIAFSNLKYYLIPYLKRGKLNLRHSELRRAIRRRFFRIGVEDGSEDEGRSCKCYWHRKLADHFQNHASVGRKTEELLHHLQHLDDDRIIKCLTDWSIFDRLFSDIRPRTLVDYWKHQQACLVTAYTAKLQALEAESASSEYLSHRTAQVARVFLAAGHYDEALGLVKGALKIEKDFSNSERLANLYGLMSEIFDEKLKLHDFVSHRQLPDLKRTISYGRKSIELREKLSGEENKLRLGLSLMKLAFSLDNWEACGADVDMSAAQALSEGNRHINRALSIFTELNDIGHKAEALMTKGVLASRGSGRQLRFYHQAMDISQQLYGEHHVLVSRLYINIGIVYEDKGNYLRAYEYFKKWARVTEEVLGPNHPKTLRARNVLNEDRYKEIAEALEQVGNNSGDNSLRLDMGEEEESLSEEEESEDEDEDEFELGDISSRLMMMEFDQ